MQLEVWGDPVFQPQLIQLDLQHIINSRIAWCMQAKINCNILSQHSAILGFKQASCRLFGFLSEFFAEVLDVDVLDNTVPLVLLISIFIFVSLSTDANSDLSGEVLDAIAPHKLIKLRIYSNIWSSHELNYQFANFTNSSWSFLLELNSVSQFVKIDCGVNCILSEALFLFVFLPHALLWYKLIEIYKYSFYPHLILTQATAHFSYLPKYKPPTCSLFLFAPELSILSASLVIPIFHIGLPLPTSTLRHLSSHFERYYIMLGQQIQCLINLKHRTVLCDYFYTNRSLQFIEILFYFSWSQYSKYLILSNHSHLDVS